MPKLQTSPRGRQRPLPLRREELWEALPEVTRHRCRELFAELVLSVARSQLGGDESERED